MTKNAASDNYDPRAVRRGRFIALMLFAIAGVPVILASAMYFGGWGAAGGASNKGELLDPVRSISEFQFVDQNGKPLSDHFRPAVEEAKWLVLILADECDAACEAVLHQTRQVHVALGRESKRVWRAVWARGLSPGQLEDYPALQRLQLGSGLEKPPKLPGETANLADSYQIYVVDPNGNVILRYDNSNSGEDLLDDLKKLLRLSNIG